MIRDWSLGDRVALVTGGRSGICRAAAIAFAQAGAKVILVDGGGSEAVRAIAALGGDSTFVRTDVAREEKVAALVA